MTGLLLLLLLFQAYVQIATSIKCTNNYGEWRRAQDAPGYHLEGPVAQINNTLYVISGFTANPRNGISNRVDKYDIITNKWERSKSTVPIPISHCQAATDGKRYIYIAGGFVGKSPGYPTDTTWRYDTMDDSWKAMPPLPYPVASSALVMLGNELHLIGGLKDRSNDVLIHWTLNIDDVNSLWIDHNSTIPSVLSQSMKDQRFARNHVQGIIYHDDRIYLLGGQHNHDPGSSAIDLAMAHAYDHKEKHWKSVASLPHPRSHCEGSTIIVNDSILLLGGRNNRNRGTGVIDTMTEYDPTTDKWRSIGRTLPRTWIGGAAGYFKDVTLPWLSSNQSGDYVMITVGGLDYNLGRRETYVSRVTQSCK